MKLHADKEPVITLEGVSLRRDDKTILSDVNLAVHRGDFIAVTGPNGGGKTSLLRLILNLIKPSKGRIEIVSGVRIGYLPQKNSVDSKFPVTVREVIASSLINSRLSRAEQNNLIEEAINLIELRSHADSPIGKLSGGQLQRTLFARAIVAKPELLILDEPLSYLDEHFERRLYDIISELSKTTTIILVSHQMTHISSMANRHIVVDHSVREVSERD